MSSEAPTAEARALIDADELAGFLLAHLPHMRGEEWAHLDHWLAWFAERALIGLVRQGGRLVGAGIVRPVATPEQFEETYAIDEGGTGLVVESLVLTTPAAMAPLWAALIHRTGRREWAIYRRARMGDRVETIPFPALERFARFRIDHTHS